jgi:hypothetical protein
MKNLTSTLRFVTIYSLVVLAISALFFLTVLAFAPRAHAAESIKTDLLRSSFNDTIITLDAYDREAITQNEDTVKHAALISCFNDSDNYDSNTSSKTVLETCTQDIFGDTAN